MTLSPELALLLRAALLFLLLWKLERYAERRAERLKHVTRG